MSDARDLLIEIGTEELPPKALRSLSHAFRDEVTEGLTRRSLSHGDIAVYATPRRLALLISELDTSQPERQLERKGPALAAAFDDQGKPTKAAEGFARSCGVAVEHLQHLETEKERRLVFRTTEVGQSTTSLIPEIVTQALSRLPIPKRMRWSDLEVEFVRPVHWVVLLYGDEHIDAEILGASAGRTTYGHRFHHPDPLSLDDPSGYATLLWGNGHVIADFATRRGMIRKQVCDAAAELGGTARIEDALLDEVTALVEWPVAVAGDFDGAFLDLPDSVLVASMQGHQKYFPVVDEDGALMPHFVAVSNIESLNPPAVKAGNERVIRPRLSDAAFFFAQDRKTPLIDRLEGLKTVVYQKKLGTMFDKSQRVSDLAAHVAMAMGEPPDEVKLARRAGLLCKCDLATDMVGEFPELQGSMGREYAARGGEAADVAMALEQVYQPRFAGDKIPGSAMGRAVALADKLDTLVGIFGIGQSPTGDKDPFALRRTALGVLRIIVEGKLDLELRKLLAATVESLGALIHTEGTTDLVHEFMIDRLRGYFLDQGISGDVFAAVAARKPGRPYDFARRVHAVAGFRSLDASSALAAANKRIQNILKQADHPETGKVDDTLLREDAEWNLAAKLVGLSPRVKELLTKADYSGALTSLAGLRDDVDAFFDQVKVMDEDPAIRNNRLALLSNIHDLFIRTADISLLQNQP